MSVNNAESSAVCVSKEKKETRLNIPARNTLSEYNECFSDITIVVRRIQVY